MFVRNQKVLFRPTLEEIKARYFKEIKKFMCLPHQFRGLMEKGVAGAVNFGDMVRPGKWCMMCNLMLVLTSLFFLFISD